MENFKILKYVSNDTKLWFKHPNGPKPGSGGFGRGFGLRSEPSLYTSPICEMLVKDVVLLDGISSFIHIENREMLDIIKSYIYSS